MREYQIKIMPYDDERCTRTVALCGSQSLHDLHAIIAKELGFEASAYVFFMSGEPGDADNAITEETGAVCRLESLALSPRMRFAHFVDVHGVLHWLDVEAALEVAGGAEAAAGYPKVLQRQGEAPRYGADESREPGPKAADAEPSRFAASLLERVGECLARAGMEDGCGCEHCEGGCDCDSCDCDGCDDESCECEERVAEAQERSSGHGREHEHESEHEHEHEHGHEHEHEHEHEHDCECESDEMESDEEAEDASAYDFRESDVGLADEVLATCRDRDGLAALGREVGGDVEGWLAELVHTLILSGRAADGVRVAERLHALGSDLEWSSVAAALADECETAEAKRVLGWEDAPRPGVELQHHRLVEAEIALDEGQSERAEALLRELLSYPWLTRQSREDGRYLLTQILEENERTQELRSLTKEWQAADRRMGLTKEPLRREAPKVGRNDPCPCGSGKKYKKCCGADA